MDYKLYMEHHNTQHYNSTEVLYGVMCKPCQDRLRADQTSRRNLSKALGLMWLLPRAAACVCVGCEEKMLDDGAAMWS